MQRSRSLHPLERAAQSTFVLPDALHLVFVMPFDKTIKGYDLTNLTSVHDLKQPALHFDVVVDRRQEASASKRGGLKLAIFQHGRPKVDVDGSFPGILNAAWKSVTRRRTG